MHIYFKQGRNSPNLNSNSICEKDNKNLQINTQDLFETKNLKIDPTKSCSSVKVISPVLEEQLKNQIKSYREGKTGPNTSNNLQGFMEDKLQISPTHKMLSTPHHNISDSNFLFGDSGNLGLEKIIYEKNKPSEP